MRLKASNPRIPGYRRSLLRQINNLRPADCQLYTSDLIESEIYSINIRPSPEIASAIKSVSDEIRSAFPHHFYYPPGLLHDTLLARIPQYTPLDILVENITKFKKQYPLVLRFRGIGASNRIISIPNFDLNDQIHPFRQSLRSTVATSDDYTIYDPVWENILWVNFIRYKSRPDPAMFKFILRFRNRIYGTLVNPPLLLYLNKSQTLDPKSCKLITTIA